MHGKRFRRAAGSNSTMTRQDKQIWTRVGKVGDFPEGEKIERSLNRSRIFILRQDDRWYAFECLCPHMSRPLDGARVIGNIMECRWHNMCFDIETGEILYESGFIGIPDLKVYPIKVKNGQVYVKSPSSSGKSEG